MILIDTSVWADHFRKEDPHVSQLLGGGRVAMHPFVLGELALGNLRDRATTVIALRALPATVIATEEQFLTLVVDHDVSGSGIGFVDAHLLAAALLNSDLQLWTRDKRLDAKADHLGARWTPH